MRKAKGLSWDPGATLVLMEHGRLVSVSLLRINFFCFIFWFYFLFFILIKRNYPLLKHKVLIVCPFAPPNTKALYSTLPHSSNSPPVPSTNQALSSPSVQLQLVTINKPPWGFTSAAILSLYPSQIRLPCSSFSSERQIASKVPLSKTTSQPPLCSPDKTSSRSPRRRSHVWNRVAGPPPSALSASSMRRAREMLLAE